MRRWPSPLPFDVVRPVVPIQTGFREEPGLRRYENPDSQGDIIEPWCVSGGLSCWPTEIPFPFGPADDGVQLVAHQYIPDGYTGYVKGIKVGPFKPGAFDSSLSLFPNSGNTAQAGIFGIPNPNSGFWETPFGWECYVGFTNGQVPARWFWHLRFIPGELDIYRAGLNLPPFSALDPNSWFLIPDIPVPRAGYPFGIPGSSPGAPWARQRMQRLGKWEESQVHVVVPGNTTICLFTEWNQQPVVPSWYVIDPSVLLGPFASTKAVNLVIDNQEQLFYPLLPSFGQLIGYSQPNNRTAGQRAAREGWQS